MIVTPKEEQPGTQSSSGPEVRLRLSWSSCTQLTMVPAKVWYGHMTADCDTQRRLVRTFTQQRCRMQVGLPELVEGHFDVDYRTW